MKTFVCTIVFCVNVLTYAVGSVVESTDNDILGIWKFDEGKGTVVLDSSEKANSGKAYNTQWVKGYKGKALAFDGRKSYVVIPHTKKFAYDTYLRISLWIYPKAKNGTLVSKYEEVGNKRSFILALSKGKLSFSVVGNGKGGGWTSISSSEKVELNKWHHVIAEFDAGKLRLFVDDKLVGDRFGGPRTVYCSDANLQIGRYFWGAGAKSYFKGIIDELVITAKKPAKPVVMKTHSFGILTNPSDWEIISGKWEFEEGEVTQSTVKKGELFLLKWKKKLPDEPFLVKFEVRTYESKNDTFKPQAYLVVRSDSTGKSGYGFGVNRAGGGWQIWWKEFPSDTRVDFARDKSGKNWGGPWRKFAIVCYDSCYELYYPRDVRYPQLPADLLVIRGHLWRYATQKYLVLRTNGAKASFRNIEIIPLKKVKPFTRFKITAPVKNKPVMCTRPVLKWRAISGEDGREDYDYYISIIEADSGKVIIKDVTMENEYQPAVSLRSGRRYRWSVEVKDSQGSIWGGKFSGEFAIASNAQKNFDAIKVIGPEPKHFEDARPMLVWKWDANRGSVDRIEIYRAGRLVVDKEISGENEITYKPDKDLDKGLNQFILKLYHKNKLVESVDTFAVRTQIPEQYTIRKDGVLLCNGKVVVPIGAFRDPSDTLTRTDGLEEAGFNLTHSYYFEGSTYYNIKKGRLKREYSVELLNQLIEDARNYLHVCQKHNIKVALSIRRSWIYYPGEKQQTELIRKYVAALMGEPALLTWYLHDEPDYLGYPAPVVRKAYMTIKEVDPYHPVSICYAHNSLIPRYIRCCDILWNEAYHLAPMDTIRDIKLQFEGRINSVKFGVGFNDPNPFAAWAILGVFDQKVRQKKRPFSEHRPNPQEVIAQTYAAMIGKARGVIYYWFPHNWYDIRKDTPHIWKAVVSSGHQLNTLMPYLLEEGQEIDVPSNGMGIIARAKKLKDGKVIIVLLNTQNAEQGKTLKWRWNVSSRLKQAKKLTSEGKWELSHGKLSVILKPLEGIAIILRK